MRFDEVREVLSAVRRLCSVRPLDAATHDMGLRLAEQHALSVYDATIVAAASQAGCKAVYTEDFQHHRKLEGMAILNPFD